MAQSIIGALRVNLGLDSDQFQRGVKQAQSTTQKLGQNLRRAGAAVSVVGAGIGLAIRGQLGAIDDLAKTSQQIGVPVDALSELRHAADLSGVSMSDLERGLRNTGRTMANTPERFEELGVAVRDVDGNMRSTIDVFEDAASELSMMEDGAEKTALAMQLFGERAGPGMIPLLNQGKDGIREMREEAEALGLSVSEETAESVQAFNDNMTRLSNTFSGIVQIMASELAPTLNSISEALVRGAEVFQDLSPPVRRAIAAVGGLTVVLGPILIALGALVTVVGAISAPVLVAIAVIAGLTAAAIAFWPQIKAAGEAVAEFGRKVVKWIGDTVRDIVDWFKTVPQELYNTGVEMFRDLLSGMISVASQVIDWVSEQARKIIQFYVELPGKLFAIGKEMFRDLLAGMNSVAGAVMDWIRGKADEILSFFTDLPGQLAQVGRDMMTGLRDGISERLSSVRDSIRGAATGALDTARDTLGIQSPSKEFHKIGLDTMKGFEEGVEDGREGVESMMQRIASGLTQVFSAAFDGARSVREEIGRLLDQLAQALLNNAFQALLGGLFGGGGGGFLSDLFGGFRAKGGPVSSGRAYVVGEQGPEIFQPSVGGRIVGNHQISQGGSGNVRITLGEGLRAEILDDAARQSVQIVQQDARQNFNARMNSAQQDRRRRG